MLIKYFEILKFDPFGVVEIWKVLTKISAFLIIQIYDCNLDIFDLIVQM